MPLFGRSICLLYMPYLFCFRTNIAEFICTEKREYPISSPKLTSHRKVDGKKAYMERLLLSIGDACLYCAQLWTCGRISLSNFSYDIC